jgi:hypothetical protein
VKKNNQDENLFNTNISEDKNFEIDKIKTTNVNILLNRVRLDKRKTLKKRIIFIIFLISIVSSLIVFLSLN